MLIGPSLFDLGDNRGAGVVLLDAAGDPIFGFDASRPAGSVLSNVTVSPVSALLSAANPDRRELWLYNDSGRQVRVALDPTASLTAFTFILANNQLAKLDLNGYTGDVSAITASGSGPVRVTEIA